MFVRGSVHVVHTQTHPQCYTFTSYELTHNMSYLLYIRVKANFEMTVKHTVNMCIMIVCINISEIVLFVCSSMCSHSISSFTLVCSKYGK